MKPKEPLPLYHSWPLFDRERYFMADDVLDRSLDFAECSSVPTADGEELAKYGIGLWECDLSNNRLTWTAGVYDIFRLPRHCKIKRDDIVALYCDESRVVMENLRAYAIKHRRGFTVDMEIHTGLVRRSWMRLTAAPVCEGNQVVRLQGVKQRL